MAKFVPKGPKRFSHQIKALRKIIETRGVCALLMEPGTAKTAPTLDYLSILALKTDQEVQGTPEIRVLAISPKSAVDNWVLQAQKYVHDDVNIWAEALGGSILQKCQTLASRGPYKYSPRTFYRQKDRKQVAHRALNADRAELLYIRSDRDKVRGPNEVTGKPRIILLSTNYEMFASRQSRGSRTVADDIVQAVKRFQPDVIICDESHKIKSNSSNTSRLIARIGQLSPRRLILTGTPMAHSPMDIFGQWRFLEPQAFGYIDPRTGKRTNASWGQFRSRFGVMGGFMGREVVSYKNLDEMQRIMSKNSIVVKKSDALDLPKMTDTIVSISLSPREQRAYKQMKDTLATQMGSSTATAPNRLTQMLRLRQITSGYLPDDTGTLQKLGDSKVRAVASIANDTLEYEKRIAVFALFKHEITELKKALEHTDTDVLVIDGSTPHNQRLAIRKRFGSSDPKRIILIAQISTISLSVNELVTASNAIFASLSHRRDDLIQARDRLNRLGQKLPCTFWYVLARDSVDEVIYRSHQKRTDLEQAILQHVQNISDNDGKSGTQLAA